MPEEPPASPWVFESPDRPEVDDLVAVGADLEPGTLLAAYRAGMFPMPGPRRRSPVHWFSPVHRGVLPLEGLRVTRSLRKSCAHYEIRVDTAFDDVVAACGDPAREGGWIDDDIRTAYGDLHRRGWAHSVEAWVDDELAGGLYGVAIGGLFAGESMFHRRRDASKAALVGLVGLLRTAPQSEHRLLDVQWRTDHLASLGVVEIDRSTYLERLRRALTLPDVVWPRGTVQTT